MNKRLSIILNLKTWSRRISCHAVFVCREVSARVEPELVQPAHRLNASDLLLAMTYSTVPTFLPSRYSAQWIKSIVFFIWNAGWMIYVLMSYRIKCCVDIAVWSIECSFFEIDLHIIGRCWCGCASLWFRCIQQNFQWSNCVQLSCLLIDFACNQIEF